MTLRGCESLPAPTRAKPKSTSRAREVPQLTRKDNSNSTSEQTNRATEPADFDATSEHEPARPESSASEWEPEPESDDHQSLSMAVPPGFDASAVRRPRVVLHFHLSEAALGSGHALVRPEDGGPITLDQLMQFLGRTGCQVRIQPVLDPTDVAPVDGYEVPQRLRAAVRARQIADVFPRGVSQPTYGS